MSKEVLRIECCDYTISLNTNEIKTAWNRFKKRTHEEAISYCDYESSQEGKLFLLNADNDVFEDCEVWECQRPVVFETRVYQFVIEFSFLKGYEPVIIHPKKSVRDSFKFTPFDKDEEGKFTRGILTGSIDFLNSPGRFRISFQHYGIEGYLREDYLEFEVVSPKLDTKNDLESINKLINAEYENYVFEYLTLTFSSLQIKQKEKSNDIIWLSIFQSLIDNYFMSVRYIMSRPNNKQAHKDYYAHPDRIKRWSNKEIERFKESGKDADSKYFRYKQIERTINTIENRFVKYTLRELNKKFLRIYGELKDVYGDDFEGYEMMEKYTSTFLKLRNDPFFRQVGEFEGFRQESSVMQQRVGYSRVYKYWQMLECSIELEKGETNIGLKQIWKLYEIWCFLIMKRLIMKILEINIEDNDDYNTRVIEDKKKMLATFKDNTLEHSITFLGKDGEKVELLYQHTYNRHSGIRQTFTTEQRPDFVVNIFKENDFVLTYLYDSKYRLIDDRDELESTEKGVNLDICDFPQNDAINQMHRYRDAIYYGLSEDKRPKNKEVIGGYILYPGRSTSDQKLEDRFFTKSIEKVNIGAFPLLPKHKVDEGSDVDKLIECDALENHLRKVILGETKSQQISKSIPQRGLIYQIEKEPDEEVMVLIGHYKTEAHLRWILANGMYNTRAGLDKGGISLSEDMIRAKYILLWNPTLSNYFYNVMDGGPIAISSNDTRLKAVEGYKPSKPVYLAYKLKEKAVVGFEQYDFNKKEFISYLKINFKPHVVPLSELKKLLKE